VGRHGALKPGAVAAAPGVSRLTAAAATNLWSAAACHLNAANNTSVSASQPPDNPCRHQGRGRAGQVMGEEEELWLAGRGWSAHRRHSCRHRPSSSTELGTLAVFSLLTRSHHHFRPQLPPFTFDNDLCSVVQSDAAANTATTSTAGSSSFCLGPPPRGWPPPMVTGRGPRCCSRQSAAGGGLKQVSLFSFSLVVAATGLLLLPVAGAVINTGNPDAKRLYDDLLSNYNKLVRPVQNTTDPLTVRIKLKLSQLIDVVRNRGGLNI
jgi:hypothetical protein